MNAGSLSESQRCATLHPHVPTKETKWTFQEDASNKNKSNAARKGVPVSRQKQRSSEGRARVEAAT